MKKFHKSSLLIIIVVFSALLYQTRYDHNNPVLLDENNLNRIHSSAQQSYSKQWINNPNFSSSQDWYSSKQGDISDTNPSISGGIANFEVVGETRRKEISDPINIANSGDWTAFNKTEPAINPDTYTIDDSGFHVSHSWHDATADQFASISWRFNVSMDVDMSEYNITSAFLNASMYANVDRNVDAPNDSWARYDGNDADHSGDMPINQPGIFDHAFFYVEIADMEVSNPYRVAFNQTSDLGQYDFPENNYPQILTINEKSIEPVGDEQDLIYYLNRVFDNDPGHDNFTIVVGIDISCEDDYTGTDYDDWDELRITALNLTFTYEKKIDQFTSVSWNQDGEKPSDISNNTITVNEALLDFEYKINETWPTASPNSEIRMVINDIMHSETVRLSSATTSFQKAKQGGFDVTSLIEEDKNINLSVQVYLADGFTLNRSITISIDNVYLNISYTETFPDIQTNLELFVNDVNKTADPVVTLPLDSLLNITIKYTENQTGFHITNASVQLDGKVSGALNESIVFQQYSIIVNTSQLGIGIKILTITAQKDIYETKQIQLFVEVTERSTELILFLDGVQKLGGDTIQIDLNATLNITVQYKDFITDKHLANASVNLIDFGILNETNNQYNISVDAKDLGQGFIVLTITAQLINYQSQSIEFYVEVIERETELRLFLNDIERYDGNTIQFEIDDNINISVYYRDNNTKEHIINASVILVGRAVLNESFNHYNTTINAGDLDQGITVLSIFAQKVNYQPQSIQFYIEVIERSTGLQLFLNSENKTVDPTYEVTVGQNLNISVKYYDNQTGVHIDTALLQLIGEGLLLNFTRNDVLGQHYLNFNTSYLGIGVKLFSVVAQANNYQVKTIDPRITVKRIDALIITESGESQIEVEVGDDVEFKIVLNNTIFGGTVKNATVTYTWAFGPGELLDINNTGLYEAVLQNVQVGIYIVTINAFAGDNFYFETYEITLVVTRPITEPGVDLSWLIYVLMGAIVGLVSIFGLYQKHFKYPPLVRKIRKIKKKIRKDKKIKPISLQTREELIKKEYNAKIESLEGVSDSIQDSNVYQIE
ncbi:MAG: hypothetical protein ACW96S_08380, partial [Promethearchaeota archaeon]